MTNKIPYNQILFSRLRAFATAMDRNFHTEPAHIQKMADALEKVENGQIKRLIITMPPRHGKLISNGTLIPTVLGWKTHGQLKIGDMVYTPSGTTTKVIALSEEAIANMEVELSNGDVIKTHPNHEWKVYSRPRKKWIVCETRYFLEGKRKEQKKLKLTSGVMGKRGGRYLYKIPNIRPLCFPKKKLLIDPYVLGAWLGDGNSSKPSICYSPPDKGVLDNVERRGARVLKTYHHKTTKVVSAVLDDAFKVAFKELRLINNKHIPEQYFLSSVQQRLQLLAGLIDTDGHVDKKCRVRIVTGCHILAKNVMRLVRELAMRPYLMQQKPRLSTSGIQGRKVIYTIGFQPTMVIPTALPRKKIFKLHTQKLIGVKDVRYSTTPEKGKCIQVSSKEGVYLVGENLTPTHNSMLVSEMFPAWFLGRNPKKSIIFASYGQEFASGFGRKVRNHMNEEIYKDIFPSTLVSDDSSAANRFHTTAGGVYYAVGAGSSITGRGAHCLIIDDPLKSREEADSSLIRQKTKDWFSSTAYTRLEPDGAIVLVQTRWHNDDLTGWLLKEKKEDWTVINLPAISKDEKGEEHALWPERFSLERLKEIRNSVASRDWAALYMQTPVEEGGQVFNPEQVNYYDKEIPLSDLNVYIVVDPANSKNKGSDNTAIIVFGANRDGNLYVLDAVVDKLNLKERETLIFDLHAQYKPLMVYYEKYGMQLDIDFMKRAMEFKNYRFPMQEVGGQMSKIDRITRLQPLFEEGKIYFPRFIYKVNYLGERKELVAYFLNQEMKPFPYGERDDMIDALSRILDIQVQYPNKNNINYDSLYA
jgi:predicted phage terminase large subunit-like protein